MKKCGLLLLLASFTLSSCSHSSATSQITEGINQSLDALEASLPKGCETSSTKKTIASIRTQVQVCETSCEDRIEIWRQRSRVLLVSLVSLCIMVGFYFLRKLI